MSCAAFTEGIGEIVQRRALRVIELKRCWT